MDWYLDARIMEAMCGEGWRQHLEEHLEVARMIHDGGPTDVHPVTMPDRRVAWCTVSTSGKATCLGVEATRGLVMPAAAIALDRATFLGLMPYGPRIGWVDARSRLVRDKLKAAHPDSFDAGAWCVLVAPMDMHSDAPTSGTAHVARVESARGGKVASVKLSPLGLLEPIESYPNWTVRSFEKYASVAAKLWDGRNWFSFQFAAKVAGGMLWRLNKASNPPA